LTKSAHTVAEQAEEEYAGGEVTEGSADPMAANASMAKAID
jgi:hypothetical protein